MFLKHPKYIVINRLFLACPWQVGGMFALPVDLHLVSFFVTVASFSSVLISALLPPNYLPFVFLYMVGALECLLLNDSYGENVQNNDISSGKAMLSSFLLQFGVK